jgi:hypothetical protein
VSVLGNVFFALLLLFGYLAAPTALAWGWARWIRQRPKWWSVSSTVSFAGFVLASASALFALLMVLYAEGGGFEHTLDNSSYSPNYSLFFRWMQRGEVLSLAAFIVSIGGVFRRSSTRWQAPLGALGTLAFWLIATTWP